MAITLQFFLLTISPLDRHMKNVVPKNRSWGLNDAATIAIIYILSYILPNLKDTNLFCFFAVVDKTLN